MSDFKRIEEFAKVRRGASPRPIDDPKWFGGDIGWVRIVDVTRSKRYLRSTEQYLSQLGEARSVRVDKGDLIMSICATIGRPVIVDMAACIHDGFVQFYDIADANTDYLYYALQYAEHEFLGYGQHGTQANLNTTIVSRHRLFVPPLPQQRKIARILTTVDNLIEKTEALIAKYQAIKQGMMHDLFTRGVDEHGHLRPPYEEAPELYKQSELGWIPKEWGVRSLGEVAVVGGGVTLGRDLAGSQVVELPYLRVANVQDGYLDLSEIKSVSVLKSEVDRYRLEQGDMLMTEGGDFDKLGRGTVWRGQISPCLHQNHIFRVRPSKEFILPDFLAAVTASSYGKRYFLVSSKQTTNLATINSTQLKAFPIPLPNLDEQGRMIAAIASVERQIEAEQRHSNQMKQTKTGLMQDLLTGKVRVKVDEAEEVAV